MPVTGWARLRRDVDCGLRRGAWYETMALGRTEALIAVHGQQRFLPLRHLEIVSNPPTHWTIVAHASNATVIPARWAKGYAVCPACRHRQLPMGRPPRLRCDDCQGLFDVAWDHAYLGQVVRQN